MKKPLRHCKMWLMQSIPPLDEDVLVMDDFTRTREMNIITLFLKKIEQHNKAALSAPVVREMKMLFPELTTERIHALFMWTMLMFGRTSRTSCSGCEKKSVSSASASEQISVEINEQNVTDIHGITAARSEQVSGPPPDRGDDSLIVMHDSVGHAGMKDPILQSIRDSSPLLVAMSDSEKDCLEKDYCSVFVM